MESKPRYKFYLDDLLLTTEPDGWNDMRDIVKLDRTLNGLLNYPDATFKFYDDGYDYLKGKLYDESFCTQVKFQIFEADGHNYKLEYDSIIKLSKVQINERLCEIEIKPDDNSYYAKIDASRKQKATLWAGRSKNDVAITPVTFDKISLFNPQDGVYYPILAGTNQEFSCTCITVYEAFRYLIAFMTDDTVDFDSTLFGAGGDEEGLVITNGTVLFTVQTGLSEGAFKADFPAISFDTLFKEIYKEKDIGFYIDYSGLKPKIWIERERDIPNGIDIVTLDNVGGNTPDEGITTKIATDRLYNIIKLGSTETLDVGSLAFPEDVDYIGFKEEEVNALGDCAVDTSLDLVNEWIISSNVIEDAVRNASDEFAENIFLISTTLDSGIYVANQTNNLDPAGGEFYYNQDLINSEKLNNFFGAIPTPVANFLDSTDNLFQARRDPTLSGNISSPLGVLVSNEPVQFNNDYDTPSHDVNNRWGNGTTQGAQVSQANSRFTAFANGLYSFKFTVDEIEANAGACLTIAVIRHDSFDVEIGFANFQKCFDETGVFQDVVFEMDIYLEATDYVQVDIGQPTTAVINDVDKGITMELVSAPGISFEKTFDPREYLGLFHEFKYPLSKSQYKLIKTNPRGNILFGQKNQNLRRARIDTIQFNPDGESTIKLITTINGNA